MDPGGGGEDPHFAPKRSKKGWVRAMKARKKETNHSIPAHDHQKGSGKKKDEKKYLIPGTAEFHLFGWKLVAGARGEIGQVRGGGRGKNGPEGVVRGRWNGWGG